MSKENKIAIVILVVGIIAVAVYWFIPLQGSKEGDSNKSTKANTQEQIILPKYDDSVYQNIPEVKNYISDLKKAISNGTGIVPLQDSELDSYAQKAQAILLKNLQFLKGATLDGKPMHSDMMRILPAIISSMNEATKKICQSHKCYQAERYNFVTNSTTRAIVDVDDSKVLSIEHYPNTQPDISLRLKHIAEAIALHAPEVAKELGKTPRKKDITMANVRGSMKESPCEDTSHLCVAPTFADTHSGRALWAVVDLTRMRLAAAKWAGLGKTTTPACISERSLQNRYIMKNFCQKDTILQKNGWKITYHLTGSDGLEIRDVSFKGKSILRSAKIVDWHVSYKQEGADKLDMSQDTVIAGRHVEYVKGEGNSYMFGYNDAMGCPLFSTSVVLAFNGPQVKPLHSGDGFMLTQDFRNPKWPMACNYRYENRFEFYNDGSFRVVGVNKGRGCGDKAIYRPVMRIDMALDKKENFYSLQNGKWVAWDKESFEHVNWNGAENGSYPYKITPSSNDKDGYYIEPNYGQFGDHSRGDNANIFVSLFHPNEGDRDLLTLGSCCQLDNDGVEQYLKPPESIKDSHIVIWYVPRIHNDDRVGHEYCWADTRIGDDGNLKVQVWPCTVGPKFVPIQKVK